MHRTPFRLARARFVLIGTACGVLVVAGALLLAMALSADGVLYGIIALTVPILGTAGWLIGHSRDRYEALAAQSEQTIQERTTAIRSMLDVTGDGFLTFGPDLRILPEYSARCREIFGIPIEGRRLSDLFYLEARPRQDFIDGLALYFGGKAKADVIFDLLDKRIHIGHRTIAVTYRAIDEETVMCALTDVTEQERLDRLIEDQDRRRNLILRAVANRKYFAGFVEEANELFQMLDALSAHRSTSISAETSSELAARVHTFKGNASFLGFTRTETVAHDFEDRLTALPILQSDMDLSADVVVLKRQYYEEYNAIAEMLGEQWVNDLSTVSIPIATARKLETYVRSTYPNDRGLAQAMQRFLSVPLASLFSRFPQLVIDVAGRRGRRVKRPDVIGGEFRVLPDRFEPLVNALEHIARNLVDHGIESPLERELKGKPPEGEIKIEISRNDGQIAIAFSDDGQGISFAAVEEKARALGLINGDPKPTRTQLLGMLFSTGFSTADQVTAVSGRGVGLAAVQRAVRDLGGKISVETRSGRGTTFRILVPERRER